MGNCSSNKGATERSTPDFVRIMTDSGGIMELEGPLHVRNIVDDFPGYGVFRRNQVSSPLFHHEQLLNGQSYYLLPLKKDEISSVTTSDNNNNKKKKNKTDQLCMSNKEMEMEMEMKLVSEVKTAARLSSVGTASDLSPDLQVLPSPGNGIWRVKLVIDTKQLGEILSEQVNTEALIEKMRTAASSASASAIATPKRSKGRPWGLARRPIVSNVCKLPLEDTTSSRIA